MYLTLAVFALVAELVLGYPDFLFRRIRHPVVWIGAAIDWLDNRLNRPDAESANRRSAGVAALLVLVVAGIAIGTGIQALLGEVAFGWIGVGLIAASLIAQRSLAAHVADVAASLEKAGIGEARRTVGRIVGRDTKSLDETGVSRAAIESLAENFSDGVVAPVFWLAIAGLPGIIAYKAINTADSMIGHKSEKHRDFGWAAARLDDLVNLPASRMSAFLVVLAAALLPGVSASGAIGAIRRDAVRHRSPNAGWPEAAFAGALGLVLAGPRTYDGEIVDDAEMGSGGRRAADRTDIRRSLLLFWTCDLLLILILASLAYTLG